MRNFQLLRDGEPQALVAIDKELWHHFEGGEPEGNEDWYAGWYNYIGLRLACGESFADIIEALDEGRMRDVAEYLMETTEARSWVS